MRNYEIVPADSDDDVDVFLANQRRSWLARHVAAISLVVGVVGSGVAVLATLRYNAAVSARTGRVTELDARIEGLKTEQAARRVDLDLLHQSIDKSRNELLGAQRQAQAAQCHASNAKLDAEITVEQVRCYQQMSNYSACDANNQKDKAEGAVFGALIGAGLAVVTGGGSLLAVGGVVAGASGNGNEACPAVQCELDPNVIESTVLAKHGLSKRSVCDGGDQS